jgi:DNA-binding transcriptional regulator YdaS (Cro superfamily)
VRTRLRDEIERAGGQHVLSLMSGIHSSLISRIVNGKVYAYPGWRRRIAAALEVDEAELFQEADDDSRG